MTISVNRLCRAPDKLPDTLFYKKNIFRNREDWIALSTKGDKNWGELVLHKLTISHRDDYNGPSLGVYFIKSDQKRKGLGTAMINFAKQYSKYIDCNGHLVLKATTLEGEKIAPHVFYRKQQLSTLDNFLDGKLDILIKTNELANPKEFPAMLMFYPPKSKKQLNLWDKIKYSATKVSEYFMGRLMGLS